MDSLGNYLYRLVQNSRIKVLSLILNLTEKKNKFINITKLILKSIQLTENNIIEIIKTSSSYLSTDSSFFKTEKAKKVTFQDVTSSSYECGCRHNFIIQFSI